MSVIWAFFRRKGNDAPQVQYPPRQPKYCHCGKVALYKVNGTGYCRDHKHEAVARRARWDAAVAMPRHRAFEDREQQIDALRRSRERLKLTTKGR
jgi:hypothetical protein